MKCSNAKNYLKAFSYLPLLLVLSPISAYSQPAASTKFTSMRTSPGPRAAVPLSPEEISFNLNEHGVQLVMKGARAAGMQKIEEALNYNPHNTTALYNLAGLYLTEGKPKEAVATMERAVSLESNELSFRNRLAEAHFANKDIARAIEQFQFIADKDPKFEQALSRLGTLHGMLQQWDQAESVLKRAHAQLPKDIRTTTNLASVLVVQEKHDEAIALIKDVSDDKLTADLLTTLGLAYEGLGNTQQALTQFKRAVAKGSKDPNVTGKIKQLEGQDS